VSPYVLKEHVSFIFKGQWPMDKLFWDHLPFQMKDTHSFEVLGTTYAAVLCHIPQVWDPWLCHGENLKTHVVFRYWHFL